MGSYNVILRATAEHDLRKLGAPHIARIYAALKSLKEDSYPRGYRKLRVSGKRGLLRIRVGNYRIIYTVNEALKQVLVYYIRIRDARTYEKL
jgi:mRNA interferase RelE/StbE